MNNELLDLKTQYNYWLERNNKAEEFLKDYDGPLMDKYLKDFDSITRNLGVLIKKIETAMGENMTHYEKINGFKMGGE